jgi:hypothetical protein
VTLNQKQADFVPQARRLADLADYGGDEELRD